MKHYKVKALSVGGLGNKVFKHGDCVKESQFKPGRADELVQLGFLTLEREDSPADEKLEIAPGSGKEHIDKITAAELKEKLDAAGIAFNPRASKKDLYALYEAL